MNQLRKVLQACEADLKIWPHRFHLLFVLPGQQTSWVRRTRQKRTTSNYWLVPERQPATDPG